MRSANIYNNQNLAGVLTEANDGESEFIYDEYVERYPGQFITFTMPVRKEVYKEKRLFPFFEGLIPLAIRNRY